MKNKRFWAKLMAIVALFSVCFSEAQPAASLVKTGHEGAKQLLSFLLPSPYTLISRGVTGWTDEVKGFLDYTDKAFQHFSESERRAFALGTSFAIIAYALTLYKGSEAFEPGGVASKALIGIGATGLGQLATLILELTKRCYSRHSEPAKTQDFQ